MKHLVFGAVILLSGCMSVTDTSFYDDNESLLSVEVRYQADNLVCGKTDPNNLVNSIHKLFLYTESKKSLDVHKLVTKMKKTSENMTKNITMCQIKQKLIKKQSADITNAIMRRF
jgi:DNA replication protein DnaD